MINNEDTIAAISTPVGVGGIGIIRVSGPKAIEIVDRIFSSKKGLSLTSAKTHTVHYGFIIDPTISETVDECLVTVMRAPKTYTRDDTVEINCHGGYHSLTRTLNLLSSNGARLAKPGEFTMRAFLKGRIDLTQAEAVMDIIEAKTDYTRKLAFTQLEGLLGKTIDRLRELLLDLTAFVEAQIDFPEEDIEGEDLGWLKDRMDFVKSELEELLRGFESGRLFREGVSVAIIGRPNVGKSSLLNRLLQRDRAIVTALPGTTRDVIEECLNIKGLPVRIIDTAGIRESSDTIELEGIRRSMRAVESADVILAVFDVSDHIYDADMEILRLTDGKRALIVLNKIDLAGAFNDHARLFEWRAHCAISALTGEGIEELKDRLFDICIAGKSSIVQSGVLITNERHRQLIDKSLESLTNAMESVTNRMPLEITALHIRECLEHLGQITGAVTTEEVLHRIFKRFCIGK